MLYALKDKKTGREKVRAVYNKRTAKELNQAGWGIFWTPNLFKGERRSENLVKLRFCFCEMDEGTKQEQLQRIQQAPLPPGVIVESKRGFHCYWKLKDTMPLEDWRNVQHGIAEALGADRRALDACRILRMPGYYHNKQDPYLVTIYQKTDHLFTANELSNAYPYSRPSVGHSRGGVEGSGKVGKSIWHYLNKIPGWRLPELNGHWLVNGEHFTLEEQYNGNHNIIRTKPTWKDTGCFVRPDGKIIGCQWGAGLPAWCRWYDHD